MSGIKSIVVGAILALAALAQQPDYFPLQVGNQWIYRPQPARGTAWVVEVTGIRSINSNDYFAVRGFPAGDLLLRKNDDGTLVVYDEGEKREKTWVAFDAAAGEAYATEIDPCSKTAVIRTKSGPAKSPLGNFDNVLEVGYRPAQCADAGFTTERFLPYVGLLQRGMETIAGEITYSLIYARLGGFTVFSEKESAFGVTLDASSYEPGSSLTIRMTLRNTQDKPVRLTFPSGQDYDVAIRDAKGAEVYRWSANRAFPAIFRQLDFSGEKNWVVQIPASQAAGDYTATANLATSGARYEASVPFSIQ